MVPHTVSKSMTSADKLLAQMRQSPAGDWTIGDVQRVCHRLGWECLPPSGGGAHWKVTSPKIAAILTIPAKRPIKPVYIRRLLMMIEENGDGEAV